MKRDDYLKILTQLHAAIGVHEAVTDQPTHQFAIGGRTVALAYDDVHAPETLFLFVDLGKVAGAATSAEALKFNAAVGSEADGFGYFAQWPATTSMVYRAQLHLTQATKGADLAAAIARIASVAVESLDAIAISA
ncbi:MAG: hypothetical protein WKG52_06280 [Variovorax sp.]